MFVMTYEWLMINYGSNGKSQVDQTKDWLNRYGKDVPPNRIDEWAKWKHLSEYQVNTNDIVERALGRVDTVFVSELGCHRFLNLMRVPLGQDYLNCCTVVKPKTILELGVGGDSAISTAMFLSFLEGFSVEVGDIGDFSLISVDRNPLGMTWERYKKWLGVWAFIQDDSVNTLQKCIDNGVIGFDMIFIDTIHSYSHTKKELELASQLTENILMDDTTFEGNDFDDTPGGVKRALEEWIKENPMWGYVEYKSNAVGLLIKSV